MAPQIRFLRSRVLLAIGVTQLACSSSGNTPAAAGADAQAADATIDFGGGDATASDALGGLDSAAGDALPSDASGSLTLSDGGSDAADTDGSDARILMTVRRPFLVGSSLRSASARLRSDWARPVGDSPAIADERTRTALADAWLEDGLQEHASIAAFARFSMLLLSVGAPPELVVGSQRASLDEVAHARECFALAQRYGAGAVGPGVLSVSDALATMSLADVAALTAEEGCVGETLGVVLAAHQLAHASDARVRSFLQRVVADETRHAELAWRFVRWAMAQDDRVLPAVEKAIDAAVAGTRSTPRKNYGVAARDWHAHGRLTCDEARLASEQGIREVIVYALRGLARVREASATTSAFMDTPPQCKS
jgi:hypothetical protein